ncbi:MAG: hypothetical protein A3J38_08650 [Gammaproteobacteria bacterium RIFCSPHIGHO2_12_FULL_45_9]|nr:MAG: hypothetical protein A3J38_08650 [Gammaproteobacteria bacterium RIFCSPHIGHO2_12_FULL_45_9]
MYPIAKTQNTSFLMMLKMGCIAFVSAILSHHLQVNNQHALELAQQFWQWLRNSVHHHATLQ